MRLWIPVIAAVAGLVAAGLATASPTAAPQLNGTVGPGFTITLKKKGSTKKLKTLPSGRYKIVVSDKADIHNFQLEGPGLDRRITTVGFTGTKTVTVQLRKGKYKYYCMPHESSMFGFFNVT
jgi:plastocyanin